MKALILALAATTAMSGVAAPGIAAAQPGYYGYDRDRGHDHDWDRDRDRDHHHWRYYGGRYGYNGYEGRWRTGQRYPYWRDDRYIVSDWQDYNLPPPQPGYAYYRDDNGDVVMAALASGVIGLILGGALADNNRDYDHHYYRR